MVWRKDEIPGGWLQPEVPYFEGWKRSFPKVAMKLKKSSRRMEDIRKLVITHSFHSCTWAYASGQNLIWLHPPLICNTICNKKIIIKRHLHCFGYFSLPKAGTDALLATLNLNFAVDAIESEDSQLSPKSRWSGEISNV